MKSHVDFVGFFFPDLFGMKASKKIYFDSILYWSLSCMISMCGFLLVF